MQPGKRYFGITCEDCSAFIAIAEDPRPEAVHVRTFDVEMQRIRCPHCLHLGTYPASALKRSPVFY